MMGMYDTISVFITCPYCGTQTTFEGQTKDLDCTMDHYHTTTTKKTASSFLELFRGNKYMEKSRVPDQYQKLKYVSVGFVCRSVECQFDGDRDWISIQYSPSGFGRTFEGKIDIKQIGKEYHLVDDPYDLELDGKKESDFAKYQDKWTPAQKKKFQVFMKKHCKGQEVIACRNFRGFKK